MCEEISGWDGSACGQAEGNRNPAQPAPGNARKHQAGQRPGSGLELDEVCDMHTSSPLTFGGAQHDRAFHAELGQRPIVKRELFLNRPNVR